MISPFQRLRLVFAWKFLRNNDLTAPDNCVTKFTNKFQANVFISTFFFSRSEDLNCLNIIRFWKFIQVMTILSKISATFYDSYNFWTRFEIRIAKGESFLSYKTRVWEERECICKELEPINHKNVILLMWKNLNTFVICINEKQASHTAEAAAAAAAERIKNFHSFSSHLSGFSLSLSVFWSFLKYKFP